MTPALQNKLTVAKLKAQELHAAIEALIAVSAKETQSNPSARGAIAWAQIAMTQLRAGAGDTKNRLNAIQDVLEEGIIS